VPAPSGRLKSVTIMNLNIFRDKSGAESGQALVDYSFILILVAIVCFAALQFIGTDVLSVFNLVANGFPGA
jgi:Flp pilus assembly pilin Flp